MRKDTAAESLVFLRPKPPREVGWWARRSEIGWMSVDGWSPRKAKSLALARLIASVCEGGVVVV
jgi:glycine cleavage system aminomethyltransferase T